MSVEKSLSYKLITNINFIIYNSQLVTSPNCKKKKSPYFFLKVECHHTYSQNFFLENKNGHLIK